MARRVSAGDRVRHSAREYNSFLDAAAFAQARGFTLGAGSRPVSDDADRVLIYNSTGGALDQFAVVELGDVVIKDSGGDVDGNLQLLIDGDTPSGNVRHTAVLAEPAGSGATVWAWVSGCHPATVNVGNTAHRRAYAAAGATSLTSDMLGPYQILNSLSGTGIQTCIVKKSNRGSIKMVGVTGSGGIEAATWSSGGSGCQCWTLTPGSGIVTLMLWDYDSGTYAKSTLSLTVYNIADAVGGCKAISFSTDDDGIPTVDVESCSVSCD